jgi:hypothetical protein
VEQKIVDVQTNLEILATEAEGASGRSLLAVPR